MAENFPVIAVERNQEEHPETLGTKEKFWIKYEGDLRLLKFGRPGTGEDWAEKAACELAELLGLPHASYDLADYDGRPGVLSPTIIPRDGRLILGNELINRISRQYDGTISYQQKEHTVSRVLAALARFTRGARSESWGTFQGYLMLDAWIGNTDRHHENWGLIIDRERKVSLAPSYDHASSLGRELSDEVRTQRLETRDARFSVRAFAAKARSALYHEPTDKRPFTPIEAFLFAAKAQPSTASIWLERLAAVTDTQVSEIFDRIPSTRISDPAKKFALALLRENRETLLDALRTK